ncbi:hypothetical protein [Tabrizicola sp. BL-A-41-H6]|uniref:hypothetical protein n=1 Tax=Tabrizicola sp. BL-A-41-H6 TaxID=3421107 RepID=UPI003D66AF4B
MTEVSIAVAVFGVLGAVSVLGYLSASRSADRIDRMKRPSSHASGLRPPTDRL